MTEPRNLGDEWIKATCRSDESVSAYRGVLNRMMAQMLVSEKDLASKVTKDRVLRWLDGMLKEGKSPRYVRWHWMIARSWFSWCEDQGLRPPMGRWKRYEARAFRVDPAAVVRGQAGRRTALTLQEARKVLKLLERETHLEKKAAILLMMVGGLRSVEVERAKWSDLAVGLYKSRVLTVWGKGKRSRQIVLEPVLESALDELRDGKKVPSGSEGKIIHSCRVVIQSWGKSVWKMVGREHQGSSHGLRRTAASLLIDRGMGIDQVQEYLGHQSAATTLICYVVRKKRSGVTTGIGGRK